MLDKMRSITGTLGVASDLRLTIHAQMADTKSAEELAQLLDGVKGLGKLYAESVPDFGKLLGQVVEATRVGADKSKVTLNLTVTEKMIEDGLKVTPKKPNPGKPK